MRPMLWGVGRTPRIPPELKTRPFTLDEARAAGVTPDALRRRSWRRLGSEIYCWIGLREDPWQLLVAWRAQLPTDSVFAGLTAAWLHRLDVDPIHPIEVGSKTLWSSFTPRALGEEGSGGVHNGEGIPRNHAGPDVSRPHEAAPAGGAIGTRGSSFAFEAWSVS